MCNVKNISFAYGKKQILNDISFSASKDCIIGVLGKNGSGKSTLLNILAGLLKPQAGDVMINDTSIYSMKERDRAKRISFVEQKSENIPQYYTIEDLILEGRRPYKQFNFSCTQEDYELLEQTMQKCDLKRFEGQLVNKLSGGEAQRCMLGRAIIKDAKVFLLDEPCSAMDIKYQKNFFAILQNIKKGKSIIITIHDINLAIQNCDKLIVLKDGKIEFQGNAKDVSEQVLSSAFETVVKTQCEVDKYFYY